MKTMDSLIENAAARLETLGTVPAPVVTGFDGFVDEMISVVAERKTLEHFDPVPDIATFGALVSAAAGQSSLREIVIHAVHAGGCAVIWATDLRPWECRWIASRRLGSLRMLLSPKPLRGSARRIPGGASRAGLWRLNLPMEN